MPDVLLIDAATLLVTAFDFAAEYGAYIAAASAVYQNVAASDAQRRARNQARDAYNAALTDRTVSYSSADSPWRIPYGEVVTGGLVAAQLTYGDRDQYQAVVIVWADCECDAITDVQLNGESLGTLDSEGRVTSGRWTKENTDTPTDPLSFDSSGHATLARPVAQLVSVSYTQQVLHDNGQSGDAQQTWWADEDVVVPVASLSLSGQVVTLPAAAGKVARANYSSNTATPYVRVRHHLGTMDQEPDAYLRATLPSTHWGPSDRLAGKCYSVFEFCLDHPELQGGPPKMTVRLRGKKVLDHRTGTTAWSANAALCTLDYLRADHGKAQPDHTIHWASWDAAANVCDEALASHEGAMRYRCDGVVTTSSDPDQVLQQLCQAMAGSAVYAGVWYGLAGAYTAPVMDLGPADNAGSVEVVGTPQGLEVFNGLRGQFYDRDRYDQLTDYTPYQNTGFVATDGEAWWGPLNLPFTSENWRAHNLARIEVERSRGMTVLFPAKRRAITLRPGQRVRLSVPTLGLNAAIFRVVKKEYRPGAAVALTLVQDDPSFWDEADAPAPLASPAAAALDPFTVAAPLNFAVVSSEAVAVRDVDGSVISRARATWLPTDDGLVQRGGALQMELRLADSDTWVRMPEIGPSATQADLQGLQDKRLYAVRARWRNSWGHPSDWRAVYVQTNVPVIQSGGSGQAGAGAVNWVATGGAQARGNQLTAGTGTSHYGTSFVYSAERYPGGAQVMCTTQQSGNAFLLGLSTAASSASWGTSGDYFIAREGDSSISLYDRGSITTQSGSYGAGTSLGVRYDGQRVQWLVNGTVVHEAAAPAGLVHAAKWDPAAAGVQVEYATFIPVVAGAAGATGPTGAAGPQGPAGPDGATLYTWIAYANTGDGSSGFTTGANAGQTYIGIANNKTSATESTNPADYTWSLIKGDQGVPGTPGTDGTTTYTWFAYANSADGSSGFSTGAWSGHAYLGIAPNKATATESTNPADYTWSLIQGPQGATGATGPAGASVEVQYSTDAISWHSSFTTGDLYMRQRIGSGGSWSAAMRVVGEQGAAGSTGNFIDVVFKRATSQPATPTGSGTPSGWSDEPPAGSDALWMSTAEKTPANVLVGTWATPVRLTGDAGATGATGAPGPTGATGPAGESVEVQYSTDASSWHGSFTTGDLYMRQRVGTGAWSAAMRVVGEQGATGSTGNFIDYVFKRATSQPTTPTGSGTPSGWSDDPPAGSDPLWMATAEKTAANVLVGAWAAPVRITGEQGTAGANSVLYAVTFSDATGVSFSNLG